MRDTFPPKQATDPGDTLPNDLGDEDDLPIPRPMAAPLDEIIDRRSLMYGFAAAGAWTAAHSSGLFGAATARADGSNPSSLTFKQAAHMIANSHAVAEGYDAGILIRWGDPLFKGAPSLDPANQTAARQARQFGYNNDYIGYLPLPAGSANSDHGLLCVNHEYTNPELMWPGLNRRNRAAVTEDQAAVEMAAHGHSVIEVKKNAAGWTVVADSRYTRRITASTAIELTGPAAGSNRLKTSADPTGRRVLGTINNCAGGRTPWGTVLIAEENIHKYFAGKPGVGAETGNHKRMGIKGRPDLGWGKYQDRFDVSKEPNEPNRFGWLVEIDPYDPAAMPVKRTALGRFKHEGAGVTETPDGRAVVYSGDDQRFEYLYKFVSDGRIDKNDRTANRNLLDWGTLYVARFNDDGSGEWLPLVYGTGPLTTINGFDSQADVAIETRRAADLLGATPMDRPEDVDHNPVNDKVYAMLTNNTRRTIDQVDKANPRANNEYGHVIELAAPPGRGGRADHGALIFFWNILLAAGDPADRSHGAKYHKDTPKHGAWLAAPDNCAFDLLGRLWISTDQGSRQRKNKIPDGMYACDLDNNKKGRALTRFFFACPRDAEMCGPEFTPDGRTLFVAVQHPAEGSTLAKPTTRWPDFKDDMPPRPAVVAITKKDGGMIGS